MNRFALTMSYVSLQFFFRMKNFILFLFVQIYLLVRPSHLRFCYFYFRFVQCTEKEKINQKELSFLFYFRFLCCILCIKYHIMLSSLSINNNIFLLLLIIIFSIFFCQFFFPSISESSLSYFFFFVRSFHFYFLLLLFEINEIKCSVIVSFHRFNVRMIHRRQKIKKYN